MRETRGHSMPMIRKTRRSTRINSLTRYSGMLQKQAHAYVKTERIKAKYDIIINFTGQPHLRRLRIMKIRLDAYTLTWQ